MSLFSHELSDLRANWNSYIGLRLPCPWILSLDNDKPFLRWNGFAHTVKVSIGNWNIRCSLCLQIVFFILIPHLCKPVDWLQYFHHWNVTLIKIIISTSFTGTLWMKHLQYLKSKRYYFCKTLPSSFDSLGLLIFLNLPDISWIATVEY